MELSLIINNTTVGMYSATGFDADKFDGARLKLAQLVSKFEKQSKVIKEDVAAVVKILDKHKAMVKDNTAAVKAVITQAAGAWDSEVVEEHTKESIPMTFLKKSFEEFDTLAASVAQRNLIGLTSMQLNNALAGSSFESIRVEFFLSDHEEDSFGINRFKLLMLQMKTGYKATKTRATYGGYTYAFNLDMLCPAMNLISVLVTNKALMNLMMPIMECYESEMNALVRSYMADWKKIKGGDADELEAPAAELDPLYVLLDE